MDAPKHDRAGQDALGHDTLLSANAAPTSAQVQEVVLGPAGSRTPLESRAPRAIPGPVAKPAAKPTATGPALVPGDAVPFVVSRDFNEGLSPAPLPAAWVKSGAPAPRMRFTAMAADGSTASGIWTCNPGVFTFIYDFDEWVHLISGSVFIEAGEYSQQLRAGSVAFFPRGLTTTWHVDDHVHKFFVQRNPPRIVRIARRLTGKKSPFS